MGTRFVEAAKKHRRSTRRRSSGGRRGGRRRGRRVDSYQCALQHPDNVALQIVLYFLCNNFVLVQILKRIMDGSSLIFAFGEASKDYVTEARQIRWQTNRSEMTDADRIHICYAR